MTDGLDSLVESISMRMWGRKKDHRTLDPRLLTEEELQDHLAESMEIQQIATEYGYDLSLYQPGNEGVVIGDFGEKARLLFEQERISEGHYVELLNLLK